MTNHTKYTTYTVHTPRLGLLKICYFWNPQNREITPGDSNNSKRLRGIEEKIEEKIEERDEDSNINETPLIVIINIIINNSNEN